MADIVDMAQMAEEQHLTAALANRPQLGEEPETDDDGNRLCLTCGVIIPAGRVAAVNAVRCVGCQTALEHQQRGRG